MASRFDKIRTIKQLRNALLVDSYEEDTTTGVERACEHCDVTLYGDDLVEASHSPECVFTAVRVRLGLEKKRPARIQVTWGGRKITLTADRRFEYHGHGLSVFQGVYGDHSWTATTFDDLDGTGKTPQEAVKNLESVIRYQIGRLQDLLS